MYLYLVKNYNTSDSRGLLKRALAHYSGGRTYAIWEGAHGKPYAVEEERGEGADSGNVQPLGSGKAPCFSVSHSGRYWSCLVSDCEVGLDLEDASLRRRQTERIAERFFSRPEQEYLRRDGMEQFLSIWVRKEAFVKYRGTGLSEGLASFSVVAFASGDAGAQPEKQPSSATQEKGYFPELVEGCCIQQLPALSDARGEKLPLYGAICAGEPVVVERIVWLPAKPVREEAVACLQNRERCAAEVRRILKDKGYSLGEIRDAEEFLKEYRYLDDERYGRLYVQAARRKGKGRLRIQQELLQKGLDQETASFCLDQEAVEWKQQQNDLGCGDFPGDECGKRMQDDTDRDQEMAGAMEQGHKILRGRDMGAGPLTDKEKAKIARRLAYLGYSASVTYKVIDRLGRD